jgi:hypothetical protein
MQRDQAGCCCWLWWPHASVLQLLPLPLSLSLLPLMSVSDARLLLLA